MKCFERNFSLILITKDGLCVLSNGSVERISPNSPKVDTWMKNYFKKVGVGEVADRTGFSKNNHLQLSACSEFYSKNEAEAIHLKMPFLPKRPSKTVYL